jgi:hypothetical protein
MKREIKEKWLAALRSGKYQQGRQGLKFKNGQGQVCHCCLGVLAELVEPEAFEKKGNDFLFHSSYGFLRLSRDKWLLLPEEAQKTLSDLNDGGRSFDEIADWIEKNVPEDI